MALPNTLLGFPVKVADRPVDPAKAVIFGAFGETVIPVNITKQDDGTWLASAANPAHQQLLFDLLVSGAEEDEGDGGKVKDAGLAVKGGQDADHLTQFKEGTEEGLRGDDRD